MIKKSTVIKAAVAVVCAAAVVTGGVFAYGKYKAKSTSGNNEVSLDPVTRGDIEVYISGSGAVEPLERYEIIPLVNGTITSCQYDVGDTVSKDDVLYRFDTSDLTNSLQKAENDFESSKLSLAESQKDTEKLTITAPCTGVVSGLTAKVGDELQNGYQLASFKDNMNLEVDIPFTAAQMEYISVGSSAEISSSEHMSSTTGSVIHINNVPESQDDGSALYFVTVRLINPGSFKEGLKVSAQINGMVSPSAGEIRYGSEQSAKTDISGTLSELYIQNGDYIQKGTVIARLTSDTVSNNIKKSNLQYDNAQLSLQDSYDKLDDYVIKSPINGTVITKNSKVGDTIDRSNSSVTMMVIADISKLKFDLEIDELDVVNVKEGMEVEITCDAIENQTFRGYISNVSVEGNSSNGVTTYTAEVVIDEPGELRPSMNVDASVIIQSAQDVLMVPISDVKTAGNQKYVFVPSDNTDKDNSEKSNEGMPDRQNGGNRPERKSEDNSSDTAEGENRPERGSRDTPHDTANGENRPERGSGDNPPDSAEGGNRPEQENGGNPPDMPEGGNPPDGANGASPEQHGGGRRNINAPDGFTAQFVETGISNDDYIEIKSGLNEGDMVYQQETSSSGNNNNMMMGGMGGPGGGMGGAPGGGMGGGAPGGGGGNRGGGPGGGMR